MKEHSRKRLARWASGPSRQRNNPVAKHNHNKGGVHASAVEYKRVKKQWVEDNE
jgi:hypothetical protein